MTNSKLALTMHKALLAACIAAPLISTNVKAENTVGIGIGSLYNGFGMNIGNWTNSSIAFASIGCLAFSDRTQVTTSSNGDSSTISEKTNGHDTNCGVGLGYISSDVLPGQRQGIGLSVALTRNNLRQTTSSKIELSLMPNYTYFFSGIDKSGFNLGTGMRFTVGDNLPVESGVTINAGYQF